MQQRLLEVQPQLKLLAAGLNLAARLRLGDDLPGRDKIAPQIAS